MVGTEGWGTAYDAVNWDAEESLPEASLYFLYNDGDYAAPAAAYTKLEGEGKHVATIAVGQTVANEYDFENGNPDNPVPWAQMMRNDYDYTGVVYCNIESVQTVLNLFNNAGMAPPYFRIANWTGTPPPSVPDYGAGTVGIQYTDQLDGGQVDGSIVSPDYPCIGRNVTVADPEPVTVNTDTYAYRATHNPYTPLTVDGELGIDTDRALQDVIGATVDGAFGVESVRALQTMLAVTVDGKIGPETVRALQEKVGVTQDGVWGPATTRAVQQHLNEGALQ
jgi:peptidoglycan hydrolase-like protein with peptidoglycan-binding domain